MSEKMITIDGKEFSENTVKNALEKSCGVVFGEKEYGRNSLFVDEHGRLITLIWCHGCRAWYLLCEDGETYSDEGVKKLDYERKVTIKELLSVNENINSLTEVK